MTYTTTETKAFLLTKSPTPIYQRIIKNITETLISLGHRVTLVDATTHKDPQSLVHWVNQQEIDFCWITRSGDPLTQYDQKADRFVFEESDSSLIFLHHDNPFHGLGNTFWIQKKMQAFKVCAGRSVHFCIEYFHCLDLLRLGIPNVFPVYHASEFLAQPLDDGWQFQTSFVGHFLPQIDQQKLNTIPASHRIQSSLWRRTVDMDWAVEKDANAYAEQISKLSSDSLDSLTYKYLYLSQLHEISFSFRGEFFRRITDIPVDFFGGDPAYLFGSADLKTIQRSNFQYHPALRDYSKTQEVYQTSKINLNLTSLQFDQAVINRVIDVASSGGFILTDWKADLPKLTSVAEAISYRSIEELNFKLEYFLHPDHEDERQEISHALHRDICHHCTYKTVVSYILSKAFTMGEPSITPLRIDLGCGPYKAEGFLGVDYVDQSGVDLVADLNQRFPFADNRVEVVRAHDVIEHLPDRLHTMNEIWRIAQPDGLVDIRVPSTDGRGAFQDPTHVSYWNINSFKYYCVEFPAYLNLCHSYGFQGAFKLEHLDEESSADGVIHVRALLRAVKEFPVDEVQAWLHSLPLRTFNLLAYPDWQQDEAKLVEDLLALLTAVIQHPECEKITLLLAVNDEMAEDADLLLSGLVMELMSELSLDETAASPEMALLVALQAEQWHALTAHITARIVVNPEAVHQISSMPISQLPMVALQQLQEQSWQFE